MSDQGARSEEQSAAGLASLRVLELGGMVSAAFAAKLCADLGADVVKVEPPSGDPARRRGPFPGDVPDPEKSGLFLYLNANKRSVVLDLPRDRERLEGLLRWADIVFHNLTPAEALALGLDGASVRAAHPSLVVCSITPFGQTGPRAGWRAEELNVVHGGGWAWLSPGASERPDLPPLKAAGHQGDFQGGLAGATAALAAHHRALETGVGEAIDLSTMAFVASFLENNFVHYTYGGRVASRLGTRILYPWGIFRCADGPIFLVVAEVNQWKQLVELMGTPEWATLEIFSDPITCARNWDALKPFLDEWMATWKADDLWRAGQARVICFAPVLSMNDLESQEQLRSRDFFVDVTHAKAGTIRQPAAPYRLSEPWWSIRRGAPLLGEHGAEAASLPAREPRTPRGSGAARRPLEGIRVTDFTWVWAGPFASMHLAHLGAEVIKVESGKRLDLARRLPVFPKDMEPSPDRNGYFNQWNQGKKSIRLNLQDERARDVARALIAKSDVVIDNYATGVMERLGFGEKELRALKPDLITASICGYGHTGPQKNFISYGPAVVQMSGLASLSGYPGEGPSELGVSYGDPNGGIHAALAIMAAIVARDQTGRGQSIDVSLWEAVTTLVPEGWMDWAMNRRLPERRGNRDPWMAPHNCYRAAGEDAWVTIACATDEDWRRLASAMDAAELGSDARFASAADRKKNEDALDEIVTRWTSRRDRWDVTNLLQQAGIAAFPSQSSKDIAEDPHLVARGFFEELEHPEVGRRKHTGIPWRFASAPNGVAKPAPLLGADTDAVLGDLLGYSSAQIAALREAGALD